MKKILFSNDIFRRKFLIIGAFIVLAFSFIIYRFSYIILVDNEKYVKELNVRQMKTYVSAYAPRGKILDRNGKILVDNESVYTLKYIKNTNITSMKEIELAKELVEFLNLNYDKVTNSNLIDYYYALNQEKLKNIASSIVKERYESRKLSTIEYISYLKKLITEDDINKLTEDDKKVAYLYNLMNIGYKNSPKIIKKGINSEEANKILKYNNFGFELDVTYKRIYPYNQTFRAYLGNVGSIPEEKLEEYLSLGYRRDDIVGISYLESEYESILKGQNEEYYLTATGEKIIINELTAGKDITLSIDIELQKDVENIIYNQVVKAKKEPNTRYYNKSYVIMSNPFTGEIYASAATGVISSKNTTKTDYLTDLTNYALTPGSIVKGASHLVGYKNGAIKIGTTVNDSCIKVKNTPAKCSWKRLGKINDLTALKYSSNYYQFLMAIKIGEGKYKYNSGLALNTDGFKKYREVYNQFGLGVKTGLDIPNEAIGYVGNDSNGGALLDYPIGQYETYTSMQLMQYINTLATSGKRYALTFLKKNEPKLLNTVDIDNEYIERVRQGLKMVMESGGTGRSYINTKYNAAGKTGTAQSFIDTNMDGKIDTETISSAFGAYMPYNDPKVSIVVFSPNVSDRRTSFTSKVNRKITKEVTDMYFKKYNFN